MRTKQEGFSLIELLIVVAVILIIAAIAIPSLLHAKMAANESSAVSALRTIDTVCVQYSSNYYTFPPNLTVIGGQNLAPAAPTSTTAQLLDNTLAADPAQKTGYIFTYTPGAADSAGNIDSYTVTANPVTPDSTGVNYYYTDESELIRKNGTQQAGPNDPIIQ